jgi:tRNA uridine 5-carboxymethylaminomethyl modification enzyme
VETYLKSHSVKPNADIQNFLTAKGHGQLHGGITAYELLKRPNIDWKELIPFFPEMEQWMSEETTLYQLDVEIKFSGYIDKEVKKAHEFARFEKVLIPEHVDYATMHGLAMEARQKLSAIRPLTVGQAARISGVNPSDIAMLVMQLKKQNHVSRA